MNWGGLGWEPSAVHPALTRSPSTSLCVARDHNVSGIKRARPREAHPDSDRAELPCERNQRRVDIVVPLPRGAGAGENDVRSRRRRIDVKRHLHDEDLVARKGSKLGGVVVVDTDAVILHKVEMHKTR